MFPVKDPRSQSVKSRDLTGKLIWDCKLGYGGVRRCISLKDARNFLHNFWEKLFYSYRENEDVRIHAMICKKFHDFLTGNPGITEDHRRNQGSCPFWITGQSFTSWLFLTCSRKKLCGCFHFKLIKTIFFCFQFWLKVKNLEKLSRYLLWKRTFWKIYFTVSRS